VAGIVGCQRHGRVSRQLTPHARLDIDISSFARRVTVTSGHGEADGEGPA